MQSRTFAADAVLENLRDPDTEPVSTLPFRPKGGELYKFKGEGVTSHLKRQGGTLFRSTQENVTENFCHGY